MKKTITRIALAALSFGAINPAAQAASVAPVAVEASAATNSEATTTTVEKASWGTMSRAERKATIKNIKKALRSNNAQDKVTNLALLTIITIFVPFIGPAIAMLLHEGVFNTRVLISLILGLLGHLPGVIYNLIVFFA